MDESLSAARDKKTRTDHVKRILESWNLLGIREAVDRRLSKQRSRDR